MFIFPIILSGGSGTRLWPLSRSGYPKQFLPLLGENSLIQTTLQRVAGVAKASPPWVICNESHRFLIAEQARAQGSELSGILLEPVARNTAPAIALAALHLRQHGQDSILLVLPSDHVVADEVAFQAAVEAATPLAESGKLVTFGIVPVQPETGYGYIQAGAPIAAGFDVARFVEKPDRERAEAYLADGGYFWNSGMFMFKASTFLSELERHTPDVLHACQSAVENSIEDLDFIRIGTEAFAACPSISIDYAVMEKTDHAVVVPLDAGWNDVGAWSSVWQVSERDASGNASRGDVWMHDSVGNHVHAEHRLVSLVGVNDLIVVETSDAVMVAHMKRAQEVKAIVDQLSAMKRPEVLNHRKVFRPWGAYDEVDNGHRFKVKRITVNPGERLSLQMHHHRAEHWVVVTGTAQVCIGDTIKLLTENESIYIPSGTKHSLENPGKVPLEIIEVQTGAYLGEDDIVRYEDRYGRN